MRHEIHVGLFNCVSKAGSCNPNHTKQSGESNFHAMHTVSMIMIFLWIRFLISLFSLKKFDIWIILLESWVSHFPRLKLKRNYNLINLIMRRIIFYRQNKSTLCNVQSLRCAKEAALWKGQIAYLQTSEST